MLLFLIWKVYYLIQRLFIYHRREKFLAEKGISIKHLPPSFLSVET